MFRRTYYVQRAERREEGEAVMRDTSFASFMCILFIFALFTCFIVIVSNWRFLFLVEDNEDKFGKLIGDVSNYTHWTEISESTIPTEQIEARHGILKDVSKTTFETTNIPGNTRSIVTNRKIETNYFSEVPTATITEFSVFTSSSGSRLSDNAVTYDVNQVENTETVKANIETERTDVSTSDTTEMTSPEISATSEPFKTTQGHQTGTSDKEVSSSWSINDWLYTSIRDATTTESTNENDLSENAENVDSSSNIRTTDWKRDATVHSSDLIDLDTTDTESIVYGPLKYLGRTKPYWSWRTKRDDYRDTRGTTVASETDTIATVPFQDNMTNATLSTPLERNKTEINKGNGDIMTTTVMTTIITSVQRTTEATTQTANDHQTEILEEEGSEGWINTEWMYKSRTDSNTELTNAKKDYTSLDLTEFSSSGSNLSDITVSYDVNQVENTETAKERTATEIHDVNTSDPRNIASRKITEISKPLEATQAHQTETSDKKESRGWSINDWLYTSTTRGSTTVESTNLIALDTAESESIVYGPRSRVLGSNTPHSLLRTKRDDYRDTRGTIKTTDTESNVRKPFRDNMTNITLSTPIEKSTMTTTVQRTTETTIQTTDVDHAGTLEGKGSDGSRNKSWFYLSTTDTNTTNAKPDHVQMEDAETIDTGPNVRTTDWKRDVAVHSSDLQVLSEATEKKDTSFGDNIKNTTLERNITNIQKIRDETTMTTRFESNADRFVEVYNEKSKLKGSYKEEPNNDDKQESKLQ